MRAMVMAAGKGTRLSPLTDVLPKPAIPVANEPVMGHLLRLLASQGINDVVSNISYKADWMRRIFGDGTAYGVRLTWSEETELLGTAGGVKRVEAFLRADDGPFLVLSGDGLHAADLPALVRAHTQAGAVATLGLTRVADPSEYGVAILDDEGLITSFQEKPPLGEELSDLANTGIYVFDQRVLDLIPAETFHDFGSDVFPALLAAGERVLGVPLDGYWNDIGGLEAYRDTNLAVMDGRVPAMLPEHDGRFSEDVLVHPSATIGDDVVITGPSVVGPDVVIEAGARISRSVLLPGARVDGDALLAAATYGSSAGLAAWAEALAEPRASAV